MILICFGTRPEYLKVKPLFREFKNSKIPFKTVFTGQHTTLLSEIDFDWKLNIENSDLKNRLNSVFTDVMRGAEEAIRSLNAKSVLVQGDTTSAAAFALSAYHMGIKIIHLEAGLRTYDRLNPYPEEVNRQLISKIADLHLCPTENNERMLREEKTEGHIITVGNTVLDNLSKIKSKKTNKVLVTLHRRENHSIADKWFIEIENLAVKNPDLKFILPIHPNPSIQQHRNILNKVDVIDPLPHDKLISLISESRIIITDSGGIQEEASFLMKTTIICRKTTERPESLGQSGFLCEEPEYLEEMFNKLLDFKVVDKCPYGDGKSSKKIAKILKINKYYE